MRAAHANAGIAPMGENPGVEVGRQPALIPNVAAIGVIRLPILILGYLDDLVIRQDPGRFISVGNGGACDPRTGAIGTDNAPGGHRFSARIIAFGLVGEGNQVAFIA